MSDSLRPHRLYPTRLLCPWNSPGNNTGVGSHSLLQRIFPSQGLNPGLLHCRQILYPLSHQESPNKYYYYLTSEPPHLFPNYFKGLLTSPASYTFRWLHSTSHLQTLKCKSDHTTFLLQIRQWNQVQTPQQVVTQLISPASLTIRGFTCTAYSSQSTRGLTHL